MIDKSKISDEMLRLIRTDHVVCLMYNIATAQGWTYEEFLLKAVHALVVAKNEYFEALLKQWQMRSLRVPKEIIYASNPHSSYALADADSRMFYEQVFGRPVRRNERAPDADSKG